MQLNLAIERVFDEWLVLVLILVEVNQEGKRQDDSDHHNHYNEYTHHDFHRRTSLRATASIGKGSTTVNVSRLVPV